MRMDEGLQDTQSLALRGDHSVVQDTSENLQAAICRRFGDAVSCGDDVVMVDDGTGAHVIGCR